MPKQKQERQRGETRELPLLSHRRVFTDFRNERGDFITAFDLILNIYQIKHHDPAVADLRESLRESEMR